MPKPFPKEFRRDVIAVGRLALLGELGLGALAARLPVGFAFAQCCQVSLSRR